MSTNLTPPADTNPEVDALFQKLLSVERDLNATKASLMYDSHVLVLSHILALSGRVGQCGACKAVLNTDDKQKMGKQFVAACATKNSDFHDALKRLMIKNTGMNFYFAELVKAKG